MRQHNKKVKKAKDKSLKSKKKSEFAEINFGSLGTVSLGLDNFSRFPFMV